jgi:hypothetical protein
MPDKARILQTFDFLKPTDIIKQRFSQRTVVFYRNDKGQLRLGYSRRAANANHDYEVQLHDICDNTREICTADELVYRPASEAIEEKIKAHLLFKTDTHGKFEQD